MEMVFVMLSNYVLFITLCDTVCTKNITEILNPILDVSVKKTLCRTNAMVIEHFYVYEFVI